MTLKANWNYPTAINFGAGRIAELADVCKSAGIKRPLLVTDTDLAKLPMVQDALAAPQRRRAWRRALFAGDSATRSARNVTDGVAAYRAGKHDGVIAFGGGSALDAGKAIAFMSGQSRPLWDFEDVGDNFLRADLAGIAPTIAVPTTAGTGSEVGRVSVITDEETHTKRLIFHPRIMPVVVIADPELTVGMPPKTTAATGMDALAHCLEAYCAPGFHPMADGIALEGIAADQGLAAGRLPRRQEHRGARQHAGGRDHGRGGVPERASAPSTRCRIRSARSTTRTTACSTACSCLMCSSSTAGAIDDKMKRACMPISN